MNRKTLFTFLLLLFIILLTVAVTLIPEILGQDMADWCRDNLKPIFGEKYKYWLLGIVVTACVLLAFLTTEQGRELLYRSRNTADRNSEKFNIPVTDRSRKLLNESKSAIEKADLKGALDTLSEIHSPNLNAAVLGLKSRLSEYTKDNHQGVFTWENKTVGYNRLNTDVIALVSKLEKELVSDENNYAEIRKYLIEKRYKPRVYQKLAGDQLFNLNIQYTIEGTSLEKVKAFEKTLQGKKTGEEIQQIFEKARRRLLVTGLPGAGKTSLLLNLALELLETDHDHLAVLLNLATWRSDFPSFDDWLREILPAELGVTKRYAADILQAGKLTLLLDGLDEVDEAHRASCLKAIGEYGRLGRDYVISTRKDEYKALEKDAPVWAQIAVQPLTKTQLLAQLDQADRRDFPEAPDLKAALEHDPLLGKVAETPFYLNCLQLLFRGGNTLSELKLYTDPEIEAISKTYAHHINNKLHVPKDLQIGQASLHLEDNIVVRFVEQAKAQPIKHGSPEQVRHWLAFLASRMTQQNKVVFELVDLQYDWWKDFKFLNFFLGASVYLFVNLFTFYLYLLIFLLVMSGPILDLYLMKRLVYTWAVGGIFYLIIIAFIIFILGIKLNIFTKDKLKFHQKRLFNWQSIFICLLGLLAGSILNRQIGAFWGLAIAIGFILLYESIYNYTLILQITTPYQRFTASAKALHFSILQHWLLRWQLYRAGVLPLRLVHFLNEMAARHLLETDGATWRFRHRILQEYFAGQWQD